MGYSSTTPGKAPRGAGANFKGSSWEPDGDTTVCVWNVSLLLNLQVLLPHSKPGQRDFTSSITPLLQSTRFGTCLSLGTDSQCPIPGVLFLTYRFLGVESYGFNLIQAGSCLHIHISPYLFMLAIGYYHNPLLPQVGLNLPFFPLSFFLSCIRVQNSLHLLSLADPQKGCPSPSNEFNRLQSRTVSWDRERSALHSPGQLLSVYTLQHDFDPNVSTLY